MSDSIDESLYDFFVVAEEAEIPSGERLFLDLDGESVVIFNIAGRLFAIGDVCTHDMGPLGDGDLDGYEIICPRHGAHFDVRTGEAVVLPAVFPTPTYPVRVVDGQVEIGLRKNS